MEVLGIWIGYGIAVAGTAFGTKDGDVTGLIGVVGAICAVIATFAVT